VLIALVSIELLLLVLIVAGIAILHAMEPSTATPQMGDPSALAACNGKMEGERLVGAFESTAGAIADWIANAAYPHAPQLRQSEWRSLPPTSTAYLCYFSGQFNPPVGARGPVGSGPQPTEPLADRALIFIDASGKQIGPSKYGPSAIVPIVRPGGRW
jgi:hypothetical protein